MIEYDHPENVRAGDYCIADVPCIKARRGPSTMLRTCHVLERFGRIVRVTTAAKKDPFAVSVDSIASVWRRPETKPNP